MIRMLADEEVPRWTRAERKNWGLKRADMVKNGTLPMPMGIGLTDVVPQPS